MTDVIATSESLNSENSKKIEMQDNAVSIATTSQDISKNDFNNRSDIVDRLKQLLEQPVDQVRDEVDTLKQLYYKLRKAEIEALKAKFIEEGNEEKDFHVEEDSLEGTLKDLLNTFKVRKAKALEAQEKQREANLACKEAILDKIKAITEDKDNINKQYNYFHELSLQFKEIKDIPASKVNETWKNFQHLTEVFYDLLKINKELRDYDFKKNQEKKEALLEEAKNLDNEKDVVQAFKHLQDLHEEWRQTGPVAPQLREELWSQFKAASTIINKKHQQFFESQRALEAERLAQKEKLCENIEAIDVTNLKTIVDWDKATKLVLSYQEEWKSTGFIAHKKNNEIFNKFRALCDAFFTAKSEYIAIHKEELQNNLAKKKELCERAEALKTSTDWREATEAFKKMQSEWKSIGMVPRKAADALWKKYNAACKYFFDQKDEFFASTRNEEKENLVAKQGVIASLKELVDSDVKEGLQPLIRQKIAEWNEIGHVPFKEKDKLHSEYKELLDKLFERANMHVRVSQLKNYAGVIRKISDKEEGESKTLLRERDKLMRAFEQMKVELKTYENNMGFLNSSSKGGNVLVKEMERKVAKLKEDIETIIQKIEMIDDQL